MLWQAKDRGRRPILDELSKVHERGEIAHAGGLLHVVGHDQNRVLAAQRIDQLFNLAGSDSAREESPHRSTICRLLDLA